MGLAAASLGSFLGGISITARSVGATMLAVPSPHTPTLTPRTLLLAPGVVVFIIGVCYPSVAARLAAARVWWRHFWTYQILGPLWTALHREFPQDALSGKPVIAWRDRLNLRRVHRRYYRRVIECRDGLVRISPYLRDVPAAPAKLAEQLERALHAHATGQPALRDATLVAVPTRDGGLDDDVHELTELSQALRRRASPVS